MGRPGRVGGRGLLSEVERAPGVMGEPPPRLPGDGAEGSTMDGAGQNDPLAVLYRLHQQLRVLSPVLTVAPGRPETKAMLDGLAETVSEAAGLLATAEPAALAALRQGFEHARAGRGNETTSELITAYGRLSVLLRKDAPRRDAADEPTVRWRSRF
ncbi:hypothetical protein G3I59_38630 [Amycolatopsis rubida]|uniref:Uncharacterized protein n=2 Tax=Amycolatopsis rubida TaxID=112413 RepID=A0ABX0C8N6_9PSEU|nr:hypothetical protein [Amycolatopsis rubida]NEC61361.1 hypothetical protein [Amycolatopsis rubida]